MSAANEVAADLATILQFASRLREAGVLTVSVGTVSFTLAPADPVVEQAALADAPGDDTEPVDPLNDPTTYGLPPGARAPAFTREEDEQ